LFSQFQPPEKQQEIARYVYGSNQFIYVISFYLFQIETTILCK
jgi:hypothetical protein